MKQIENIYDAFINAWKSMAGYINKIGGDALIYAIGLPPAVFVINVLRIFLVINTSHMILSSLKLIIRLH